MKPNNFKEIFFYIKNVIIFDSMKMTYDADKLLREVKTKRLIEMNIDLRTAAAEIGISYSTLSRVENGKPPDIETLASVCDWIGLPINLFFIRNTKNIQLISNKKIKKRPTNHVKVK